MLYHLIYPLSGEFGLFRVFRYITFRTAGAILTAMFFCFLFGPTLIKFLKDKQIGQVVRDDGPKTHLVKKGTPTMGGILILLAVAVSTLLWARLDNLFVWLSLFVLFGMGGVGFYDDYLKLSKKNPKGLKSSHKFFWQVVIAGIAAVIFLMSDFGEMAWQLPNPSQIDTRIYFPFFKGVTPDVGWLFLGWLVFVVVGSSNAVNLTDGLDGLAIGPVLTASMTFLLLSYISGHFRIAEYLKIGYVAPAGELAIFCGALFGAGLGFLWYNTYPAQVFMGDVGALAIGGALGLVAILIKQEILWALIGGIFVVETLSVVVQVASFKMTGKRVFRMAPIHHHFELKGWAEPKIIVRFWIISIMLSLLALSSLKLR